MDPAVPTPETTPAAHPATFSKEAESVAKDFLDRVRAEITQAENKASILLAGVLASVGGISAAVGGVRWAILHQPWNIAVPFWLAMVTTLAAIICLAAVIYPRNTPRPAQRLTPIAFFGDIVALESPEELRGLLAMPDSRLLDLWIDQIWQTSAIVSRKYTFIRWAVRFLGATVALAVLIVLQIAAAAH